MNNDTVTAQAAVQDTHSHRAKVRAIGFPGEIMLRLLKMLVLPLVAGSMIAGKHSTFHTLAHICKNLLPDIAAASENLRKVIKL